jgi:uncharacterized membrane protein
LVKKKTARRRPRSAEFDFDWLLWPVDQVTAAFKGALAAVRAQRTSQIFVVLLVLAAAARLMRPDWYGNRTFHPDERWLFDKTAELHVVDPRAGFPYIGEPGRTDGAGLQYGSLPLYAVSVVKDAMNMVKNDAYRNSILAGRTMTGVVDSVTVLLTFLLGLQLLGAWPALLAALIVAGSPLHIQLAHFFTVDPWMTCFSVAVLYAAVRLARKPSIGWSVTAGVAYGAALASKSGALPLALPIALAHLWPAFEPGVNAKERKPRLLTGAMHLGAAVAATVLSFAVFMPYAFLHWSKFYQNQTAQQGILVKGEPNGVPYVRQYWDTGAGFHLKNIIFFYLGIPTGLLALLAVPVVAVLGFLRAKRAFVPVSPVAARSKAGKEAVAGAAQAWAQALGPVLILSWLLPYFFIVGGSFAKFARYMLPVLPMLALLLAMAVAALAAKRRRAALALGAVIALAALGHGAGYAATYLQPHPWIKASRWALDNIPKTTLENGQERPTRIMNEDWGDDLPVEVDGRNAGNYQSLKGRPDQVNIVEWDSANKLNRLCNTLSQADVLFLADARAYGTYLRLPTRFPLTHTYYELLFSDPGRLGFEKAYEASNPIRVFGIPLPDSRIPSVPRWRWADESFTLYDRPHAFVFRRVKPMTATDVREVLEARMKELALSDGWRNGTGPEALDLQSKGQAPAVSGGAETAAAEAAEDARINPNYGTSRGAFVKLGHPFITWWLLIAVLGWLALPLAARLFSGFPAGGYALSKALGVFLFAWLAYNLAWLKLIKFHQSHLWALLAAGAALAALLVLRRRRDAVAWIRANRSEIIWSEAIFAGAFLAYTLVRAFNPNIHDVVGQGYFGGGEPLGMTYLSAVTRASTFPLFDPWLALRDSSYYYFGYVIAGTLGKLAGFPAAISYNLSLALFFSLSLVTAFGVLRGLVSRRGLALAGAALVSLAGSLWTVAYISIQFTRGMNPLEAWTSHGFIWDPTRFPELMNGHILEFPYFSYLYSDLHPHNMAVAFSLLLAGLLLVPFKSAASGWRSLGTGKLGLAAWMLVAALLLDAQYAINTWSWPVYVALSFGALAIGPWAGKRTDFMSGLLAAAQGLGVWAGIMVLGRLGMHAFRAYFLQDGGNRLGSVVPSEWQMNGYVLLAYYLPGLAGLAWLAGQRLRAATPALAKDLAWQRLSRRGFMEAAMEAPIRLFEKRPLLAGAVSGGLLLVGGLVFWSTAKYFDSLRGLVGPAQSGVLTLSLGLGFACLAFFAMQGWRKGEEAFLWVLGGFTMFLVAGSELKFVADRTNTLFKFWFNGWILMGLVAAASFARAFDAPAEVKAALKPKGRRVKAPRLPLAAALPWLVGAGLFALAFVVGWIDARNMGLGWRFAASHVFYGLLLLALLLGAWIWDAPWTRASAKGVFGALLALGLLYPVGATIGRIRDTSGMTNPHLDGLAFMKEREPRPQSDAHDYDKDDAALIEWLNSNPAADVTETLAEVPGLQMYQGYNRFSIYTGLPTLLGWEYQVGQQLGSRTGGVLQQRLRDAEIIYGANETAATVLMKRYHVRWVVVGGLERKTYAAPGLDKFQRLAVPVAMSGQSVLYRYDWDKP